MKLLKDVLFGQQKQSNDLNETVTRIIYNALLAKGYAVEDNAAEDHKVVVEAISKYINDVIMGGLPADDIFELIAGRKSVNIIKEGVPCVLSVSSVSDESTKVKFRVISLDDSISGEHQLEEKAVAPVEAAPTSEFVPDDGRYYYHMAERLKDKILPTVPTKAKEELAGNDYAIALSCVMHYFNIKEEI